VPAINTAIETTIVVDGDEVAVRAEVAQQIGDSRVRAICLRPVLRSAVRAHSGVV
jgi:F-type H+-transporting ATPase subunit beta